MSNLDNILKDINKKFKSDIATVGPKKYHLTKVPFSSPRLNYMLYGGMPTGRLVEFAGEENGGKTTTALDLVGQFQKHFPDKRVAYIDCENTLDLDWAEKLGVNIDELVLIQPENQTAEQIFEMCKDIIESGEVSLAVLDSLGVLLSAQAYAKNMEEKTYGGISSALTLFSKKAASSCAQTGCTFIGINQMREDMNSTYGGMITTGGKAWKHNCSLRLMFRKGDYIDEKGAALNRSCENPVGNLVQCNLVKSKVCRSDRRVGFYTLVYLDGIDAMSDTIDVALKESLILAGGAWYSIVDPQTGEIATDPDGKQIKLQGKAKVKEFFQINPEWYEELVDAIALKIL